jgi:hypothetical protein
MKKFPHLSALLVVWVLMAPAVLSAAGGEEKDPAAQAEARMREALRATTLQLREAQNQVVSLQAEKAQLEAEKAELTAKGEALNKQIDKLITESKADKAAADKAIAGLNKKVDDRDARITKLNDVLEKWKAAYNQAVIFGKGKEYERAKLEVEKTNLERLVADRESRNLELFKVGSEILKRYENFSLGEALTAREPFVGTTRVKMQGLVQDYADKLDDQKLTVEEMSKPTPTLKSTGEGPEPTATPAKPTTSPAPNAEPTPVPEPEPAGTPKDEEGTKNESSVSTASQSPVVESIDPQAN